MDSTDCLFVSDTMISFENPPSCREIINMWFLLWIVFNEYGVNGDAIKVVLLQHNIFENSCWMLSPIELFSFFIASMGYKQTCLILCPACDKNWKKHFWSNLIGKYPVTMEHTYSVK